MKKRKYYCDLFNHYPPVVNASQFAEMLGGINIKTAHKLLRNGKVKNYNIKATFFIPKIYIVDYILSDEYQNYKVKLKTQV